MRWNILELAVACLLFIEIHTQVCNIDVPCDCCFTAYSCYHQNNTGHVNWCHGPCKEGYWGARCIRPCPDVCVSCSQYYGQKSECYKCVSGHYGFSCELSCVDNCLKCAKNTGACSACKPGFYGSACTQRCPTNCKDKVCSLDSGNCNECMGGYSGDTCLCSSNCESCHDQSASCTYCKPGYYGDTCSKTCSKNCETQECEIVTGNCDPCKSGYFGDKCQHQCSFNCMDDVCDKISGVCTECKPGFFGETCKHQCSLNCMDECDKISGVCPVCKPGFFGETCEHNCSLNCRDNVCDKTSGVCSTCNPGFFGELCNTKCFGNCIDGLCNKTSGVCDECKNGFHGELCDSNCSSNCFNKSCDRNSGECYSCTAGHFGFNCTKKCSQNCINSICNKTTGYCNSCINGFFGFNCYKSCPINCDASECDIRSGECIKCVSGFYGEDCNDNCSQTCEDKICDKVSGECIKCVVGMFGNYCFAACPSHCNEQICNQSTGFCSIGCTPNFDGNTCIECIHGKYGTRCDLNCSAFCNNTVCDKDGGLCLHGCIIGSSDSQYCCLNNTYCDQCSSPSQCTNCIVGRYGNHCELTCPPNCIDGCDRGTGHCIACMDNQYGQSCESNCSTTCAFTETEDRICSRNKGTCLFGCTNLYYGNTCESACSEQCNGSCHHTNGNCIGCKNDTFGMFCNIDCPNNCFANENETTQCIQQNGYCSFGCNLGYFGPICDRNCSSACGNSCTQDCIAGCNNGDVCRATSLDNEPGSTTAIVSAAVSTVCVCIAVIIAGSINLIRRRKSKTTEEYAEIVSSNNEKSKPAYAHVYQNTSFNGPNDNPEKDKADAPSIQEVDITPVPTVPVKTNPRKSIKGTQDVWQALSKPDNTMKEEFVKLPNGLILPYDESRKPENRSKNRYNMIYPYDTTRVKIADEPSDYINASYIDGYRKPHTYIAALGPTTKTLGDDFYMFWQMIWQEKVETIVMLTNLVELTGMKCDKYWPNLGTTIRYGDISVNCVSEETYAEFVVRNMTVTKNSEKRQLHHIHFTAWPDKGVPSDVISINNLRHNVVKMRKMYDGPLLVHCSAGIGRTGTYIALDILTETGASGGTIDVFECVNNMRQQRVNMVQTPDQYKYLHHSVLWSLTFDKEPTPAGKFTDLAWLYSHQTLTEMLEQLQAEIFYDSEEVRAAVAENSTVSFANRNGADIPGARHTVFLSTVDRNGIERSDYINAVYIDGYKKQNQFIAAQTPLPETVSQFLNMILQEKVTCIVDLTSKQYAEDTGDYLPLEGHDLQHESFIMRVTSYEDKGTYTQQEITISEHGQNVQTVHHFKFNEWDEASTVPENLEDFLQFMNDVEKLVSTNDLSGPITVHCLTGAVKSGLFCAVWVLIEKCKVDFGLSVLNTLGQVKTRRTMAIPDEVQIAFCFESVSAYLKNLDQRVYSNMVLNVL